MDLIITVSFVITLILMLFLDTGSSFIDKLTFILLGSLLTPIIGIPLFHHNLPTSSRNE